MQDYLDILNKAKEHKTRLGLTSIKLRNKALVEISESLINNIDDIILANNLDINLSVNLSDVMKKRLVLTIDKIKQIASDVLSITKLDDPLNNIIETINRPNGLKIEKVSVPFGVILAIFESRPNVVVDIACLCIKTGNVCILRGGKEAINTNKVLVKIIKNAIDKIIGNDSVSLIEDTSHSLVDKLITMKDKIDLVVPRGGKNLINKIVNESLIPVIETGAGVCHAYIDDKADIKKAVEVVYNAKISNPAVCNAIECLLVHKDIAKIFLNSLNETNFFDKVIAYGTIDVRSIIKCEDVVSFEEEFNDLKINIKIVENVNEAINHINKYSTKHSEVIITEDEKTSELFLNSIDSACVYVNASTRFTDGGCFGFGAELGISTSKLHARGPMGLKEMTSYKYKIYGNGQVR